MSDTPPFASTREALGMLRTVMGYLFAADRAAMAAEAQAECQPTGADRAWARRALGLLPSHPDVACSDLNPGLSAHRAISRTIRRRPRTTTARC